jgi:hypothetical protein
VSSNGPKLFSAVFARSVSEPLVDPGAEPETTGGNTEPTAEGTSEETTEGTTDACSQGIDEETTQGTDEETTQETTNLPVVPSEQEPIDTASFEPPVGHEVESGKTKPIPRCTGWDGDSYCKIISLSTHATMRDAKNTANQLPVKFPLCGSFKDRDGYDQLEICMAISATEQSVSFVIRSKQCHLEFARNEKKAQKLCTPCGSLVGTVKNIRQQACRAINSDSNLQLTENQIIQMTPAEIRAALTKDRYKSKNRIRNLHRRNHRAQHTIDKVDSSA